MRPEQAEIGLGFYTGFAVIHIAYSMGEHISVRIIPAFCPVASHNSLRQHFPVAGNNIPPGLHAQRTDLPWHYKDC